MVNLFSSWFSLSSQCFLTDFNSVSKSLIFSRAESPGEGNFWAGNNSSSLGNSLLARLYGAQCVELKLRWRFYVQASTWPEFYFLTKFWIIFDISNTRVQLGVAQKPIYNIIEEIVTKNCTFFTFFIDNFLDCVSNMLLSIS